MHCQYTSEKEVETKTQTNKEKRNYFIDKEDLQVNKLTIRGVPNLAIQGFDNHQIS